MSAGSTPGLRLAARLLVCSAAAGLLLTLAAEPALAHGRDSSDATNYRSEVLGVVGDTGAAVQLGDVHWQVLGSDALLRVTNDSVEPLEVLGYEGEPYLRIGPDGVFENRRSPAAYLNGDRFARVTVPAEANADAPPQWVRVADSRTATWHDHRIHWMADTLPPQVKVSPGGPVVVYDRWEVAFLHAGRHLTLVGRLEWIPPLSAGRVAVLLIGAAVLALAPVLVVARRTRNTHTDAGRDVLRVAGGIVALVALVDVVHTVDVLVALPTTWARAAGESLLSGLAIALGFWGAWRGWRGAPQPAAALCGGAAALLLGMGLLHLPALVSSQVVSLAPAWITRAVIAANLVVVAPAGAAAAVARARAAEARIPVPR